MERSQLSTLSRMFSAAVVRDLGRTGRSSLLARLIRQSDLADASLKASVGEVFEIAFATLRASGNRDEYVYRAAITQKLLLGRHSLQTASVLNEVRIGSNRADVVVLNGTSTAYEIKSERDSLSRLSTQLDSYRRVFASVVVVTSPKHVSELLDVCPPDVGILALSPRYRLQVIREPEGSLRHVESLAIFDLLRSSEAKSILMRLGLNPPNVPNTQLRAEMSAIYATLDPVQVHEMMVSTLKQSRSLARAHSSLGQIPPSLHAAVLSMNFQQVELDRVRAGAATPVDVALSWG